MPRARYTGDRISIGEAAEILGMGEQQVRVNMQNKILDIGDVIPPSKKGGKNTYYIYRNKVMARVGFTKKENKNE